MRELGRMTRMSQYQHLLRHLVIILTGAFVVNLYFMFSGEFSSNNNNNPKMHFRFEREASTKPRKPDRPTSRVSLQNPKQSKRKHLEIMESELASTLVGRQTSRNNIVSCKKELYHYRTTVANNHNNQFSGIFTTTNMMTTTDRRCDAYFYNNVTNSTTRNNRLVFYNPLPRDQFLCGGKVILGPNKVGEYDVEKCSNSSLPNHDENLADASHSFPYPPTFENRGEFPGIKVPSTPNRKDDTFSSGVDYGGSSTGFSTASCDVKCSFEPGKPRHIYGMDAEFTYSMEGEVRKTIVGYSATTTHGYVC
mmetsp:Transcript_13392/g.28732  ORF Transcript_13392/g.28732 Transcript_13392/m.28732 type:complete len:307 (-) Transcript_13392:95-1015(-)